MATLILDPALSPRLQAHRALSASTGAQECSGGLSIGPPWPRVQNRHRPAAGLRGRGSGLGAIPPSACGLAMTDLRPSDFESGLKPLWLQAQRGDEAAYRQCLERLAPRLRAYLRRRLRDLPDEVEDLVQETLLALHLQRGTYDPTLPVTAWVVAIARHKLVDLWRRRGRREHRHDAIDDVDESLLAVDAQEGAVQRDLETLLRALPAAQRDAIVMTRLEGLSVAEAAARSGASVAAIKVQVHRGLRRLAARVKT